MIDVLVSDLGQVVLPFDFTPTRNFLRDHCRALKDAEIDPWSVLSRVYDRLGFGKGDCSSLQFYGALADETGLDASFEEFCLAWSNVFYENPGVTDLFRRTSARHRFLLSNTNEIHWKWILSHHARALKVFDELLASQELRCEKPHPEIFRMVESRTGLPPGGHLLIDDIPENISGAQACGWDGIVYTDVPNLEIDLRQRGLLT